ncbi:MAG: relaxase [Parvibaculaceae bacterium]
MILKASQRGGAVQMGLHLLRTDQNDHVEVHEIRGFVARNIVDALREAYAVSRGTRCEQFMFSLSLSPPKDEHVPVAVFEQAIDEIEQRIALKGQPRVIVFHEKDGRRHAHCVWSRIKADTMTAVNMSRFKLKLREVSRELYIEHKWQMPRGLVKSEERDPLNFSRAEWQQAKRTNRDPKVIKAIFLDCWAISDSLPAFRQAMESRGYYLARGDRRGHVAVDWKGEIYSISRWADTRPKDVAAKLGDAADLPGVDEVKKRIAERMAVKVAAFAAETDVEFGSALRDLDRKRRQLVQRQRQERQSLNELQAARWIVESRTRAERFRTGLKGLWDRLTGRHSAMREKNEAEVAAAEVRDRREHQLLVERQLRERRELQAVIAEHKARHEREAASFQSELQELSTSFLRNAPVATFKPNQRQTNAPSLD